MPPVKNRSNWRRLARELELCDVSTKGQERNESMSELTPQEHCVQNAAYLRLCHQMWSEKNSQSEGSARKIHASLSDFLKKQNITEDLIQSVCLDENMSQTSTAYYMGLIDSSMQSGLQEAFLYTQEFEKQDLKSRLRQNPRKRRFPDMINAAPASHLIVKRLRKGAGNQLDRSGSPSGNRSPASQVEAQHTKRRAIVSPRSRNPMKPISFLNRLRLQFTSKRGKPFGRQASRELHEDNDNNEGDGMNGNRKKSSSNLMEKNNEPFPGTRSTARPRRCQGARRVLDWKFCYLDGELQKPLDKPRSSDDEKEERHEKKRKRTSAARSSASSLSGDGTPSVKKSSGLALSTLVFPSNHLLGKRASSSSNSSSSAKAKVKDFLMRKASKPTSHHSSTTSPKSAAATPQKILPKDFPQAMRDLLRNLYYQVIVKDEEGEQNGFWVRGIPRKYFMTLSTRYGSGNAEYVLQSIEVKDSPTGPLYDVLLVSQVPLLDDDNEDEDEDVKMPTSVKNDKVAQSPIMAQLGSNTKRFVSTNVIDHGYTSVGSASESSHHRNMDFVNTPSSEGYTSFKEDRSWEVQKVATISSATMEGSIVDSLTIPSPMTYGEGPMGPRFPNPSASGFPTMAEFTAAAAAATPTGLTFRRPLPPAVAKPVRRVYTKTTTRPSILCHNRKAPPPPTTPLLTSKLLAAHGLTKTHSSSMSVRTGPVVRDLLVTNDAVIMPGGSSSLALAGSSSSTLLPAMLSSSGSGTTVVAIRNNLNAHSTPMAAIRPPLTASCPRYLSTSLRTQMNQMAAGTRIMSLSNAPTGNFQSFPVPGSGVSGMLHPPQQDTIQPGHTLASVQPVKRGTWQVSKPTKPNTTTSLQRPQPPTSS